MQTFFRGVRGVRAGSRGVVGESNLTSGRISIVQEARDEGREETPLPQPGEREGATSLLRQVSETWGGRGLRQPARVSPAPRAPGSA